MDREENQSSEERKYRGDDITVYWKPGACIHASYCYRELIEVFDPGRRPWIDMQAASTERIIEVVNLCPTEALTWKWNDSSKNESVGPDQYNHIKYRRPELAVNDQEVTEEPPVSVQIMIDGPVVISGSFTYIDKGETRKVEKGAISICRCGASEHMPFCDGHHRKLNFTD